MLRDEYKALYDRIEPRPSIKEETEAKMMEKLYGSGRRRSVRRTAIIAIALAALLIGTAAAVTLRSHILDRLFGGRTPSPAAEAALTRNADETTAEGLTLTLDEYLADGNTVNLAWSVTSQREEPIYYVSWYDIDDGGLEETGEEDGGLPYAWSDSSVGDGRIVRLTQDANRYTSEAQVGWPHGVDRPIQLMVHARAFTTELEAERTEYGIVALSCAEPGTPEEAALKAADAAGKLLLASDGPYCTVNGYAVYDAALGDGVENAEICAALEESGLFEPLAALEVTATIEPPADATYALAEPTTFKLPGRTVELKELRFDTASTVIGYDVIPDEGAALSSGEGWYLVADPAGRVLNVDWRLSLSGESDTIARDGREAAVWRYCLAGDSPVTELPDSLTFIPVAEVPRAEGEPSQDYWQRVADLAAPEDRFTVRLK